jgi:hypothetical protein
MSAAAGDGISSAARQKAEQKRQSLRMATEYQNRPELPTAKHEDHQDHTDTKALRDLAIFVTVV